MSRTLTPSKKLLGALLKRSSDQQRSQKILSKHRVTNSFGLSSSEKKLETSKKSLTRPLSTHISSRKPKETPKKLIVHKKAASVSEKPLSLIIASLQAGHTKHKFALELKQAPKTITMHSVRSNTGLMPGNPSKVNQDSYIIKPDLNHNSSLLAVADGHGLNGELVSSYIKERFPCLLNSNPYFYSSPQRALTLTASRLNKEVCAKDFDTNFSGSTFVGVLIRGGKLWCANVGDSRALLGRELPDQAAKGSSNHWMSIALSRDHKPNEADESARIILSGGRVEAYQDEHGNPFGPCRVWLRNQNIPGLAMSRSFGDKVASSVGVVAEPELLEFELTADDKFVVVGSDGVFEFLSNEDVVKIVVPYWRRRDTEGAAEALAREARAAWIRVRVR
jgi:serine/threonine protein phosphatase PrpC